jgi:hypothetical protein
MQFPLLKSIENTYTPVAGTHSICMPRKQASRNITYIHNTEHRTQTHYTGTTLSTQEQLSNCGNRSDPALSRPEICQNDIELQSRWSNSEFFYASRLQF